MYTILYFLVLIVIKKETRKHHPSFSIKIKLILELAPPTDRFGCFSWNRPDHYAYAYHLCIFIVFYFFMEAVIPDLKPTQCLILSACLSVWIGWGAKTGHVSIFLSLSLLHARTTRPISPYSPRFLVTMHAFSTVPSFRFQAVVDRVEIEKCVFLDSVQKRREADDNFKFTEYVVMEIILLFSIF